jgi:hypothetical protein
VLNKTDLPGFVLFDMVSDIALQNWVISFCWIRNPSQGHFGHEGGPESNVEGAYIAIFEFFWFLYCLAYWAKPSVNICEFLGQN